MTLVVRSIVPLVMSAFTREPVRLSFEYAIAALAEMSAFTINADESNPAAELWTMPAVENGVTVGAAEKVEAPVNVEVPVVVRVPATVAFPPIEVSPVPVVNVEEIGRAHV